MISQFRNIKEVKEVVKNPESRAKLLRTKLSKNSEFFQTK